jgi:beta-phosphoglucomutase
MDGVIVDSNPLHTIAWRIYLKQRGVSADGIEERMHGKRNDELVRAWFGPDIGEEEVVAHGANKEALYREMIRPQLEARLVPGIRAFLARHAGRPMAVVSNAEPANIEFVLGEAGLRSYFRAVVDGHQVERPKPHPDIYLRAAELLGAAPSQCVVFEDSRAGIEAGQAAGARVVAVKTTAASLPQVDCEVADFNDPALERWLQQLL